jgi:hypothetical protein
MTAPRRRDRERLIGVLIPASFSDRPRPRPAGTVRASHTEQDLVRQAIAGGRGAGSAGIGGRVTERGLMRALGWTRSALFLRQLTAAI